MNIPSKKQKTLPRSQKKRAMPSWFRVALLVLAIFLLLVGITQGEGVTFFVKATHLCLECVGIG